MPPRRTPTPLPAAPPPALPDSPALLPRRQFLQRFSSAALGASLAGTLLGPLATELTASTTRIAGVDYRSLSAVGNALGMRGSWVQAGQVYALANRQHRLVFRLHKRDCQLDGIDVYLGNPVAKSGHALYISRLDEEQTLAPLVATDRFGPFPKLYRIVLDPGHGGKDPGAENRRLDLNEKTLTLDILRRLEPMLSRRGYKVTFTREDDSFVPLSARPAMANRVGAQLFLSLHFNAATATEARGLECYAFTPRNQPSTARSKLHSSDQRDYPALAFNTWNTMAGYLFQKTNVANLRFPDRGLRRARFTILRDLRCPGVLVEGGFLSNPAEARVIRTAQFRERLARSLSDGIHAYQLTLNRLRGI